MIIETELIEQVIARELTATKAYLANAPVRAPGRPTAGKAAGWRRFRYLLEDHAERCELVLKYCRFTRLTRGFE